jgi:hypothetical protein
MANEINEINGTEAFEEKRWMMEIQKKDGAKDKRNWNLHVICILLDSRASICDCGERPSLS